MESPGMPFTPLLLAILMHGTVEQVKKEIKLMIGGKRFVNRPDPNMQITPLIGCTLHSNESEALKIAQYLVKLGADINLKDSGPGSSPLLMAAQNGKPQLIKYFLSQGAKIDTRSYHSSTTTVMFAIQNNHTECAALLINACREQNKLHVLNIPNQSQGRSPTWKSVSLGRAEILGMLAKAGADLRNAFPCYYEMVYDNRLGFMDPDSDMPIQYALGNAVLSHVYKMCVVCRKSANLNCCGRCKLACYCSKECQAKDYKIFHKKVCKQIRAGMDMIGDPSNINIPPPKKERFGFQEDFAGTDFSTEEIENPPEKEVVWEYNDAKPGNSPEWKRYPPNIEYNIESLLEIGSPRYMYRPGHPKCEGKTERELTTRPPNNVATRFIYFENMIEQDVYTGAGRAIRRNGSLKLPNEKSFRSKNSY